MILLLALALEWWFGDPPNRWHPVAWFGQWAAAIEARCYRNQRLSGVRAWFLVVGLPLVVIWVAHSLAGWALDGVLLWITIGWKSLFSHVDAVISATTTEQARRMVARIVSRDSSQMDITEARRAALESLAENANDAVIAPIFWFVVAGAPGAVLYRMINTLDASWGYRNARYRQFGCWAAQVDDVAGWIPARITAIIMLTAGVLAGNPLRWRQFHAQATSHASPNAGWPEAALAWAACVQLGGPVVRAGVIDPRPWYGSPQARAVDHAVAIEAVELTRRTLAVAAIFAVGVTFGL